MYTIEHSNGRRDSGYETLDAAIAQLRLDYDHVADLEIAHDADGTVARDGADSADYAYLARVHRVCEEP